MTDASSSSAPPTKGKQLRAVNRGKRFAMPRTISALILREMGGTYGRSPGGYLWALAEPLLGIALLSAIFSIGFRSPRLGENFPIFYATGVLPFFLFNDVSSKTAQAVNYSRQLLAYPRVTLIDAVLARYILALLTQLLISYVLLTGILWAFETRTTLEVDRVLMAYSMAAALGLGVGILNCFLMSMFQVWQRAYNIMTRPLLLVSGVIFIYESIPDPYQSWLWWNPLMHVTGELRGAFYKSYEAAYVTPAYVFGFAAISGAVGLLFLWRYYRDIMEL
ncbi:ABC transporter permease [Tateyamaria omphalii]|uniref:ABC transporter permease n=1 Tax=Tateyamaria omphalii TaxID=299262 RepID=UPI001C98E520|nr:ABC transporter permease [Tateyamaria omphalii]MBY5935541.1 ABC transporter permease [Tateyamaria omphalii]